MSFSACLEAGLGGMQGVSKKVEGLQQQRNKLRQELRSLKASCSEQAASNEQLEQQLQVLSAPGSQLLLCLLVRLLAWCIATSAAALPGSCVCGLC